jgi:hypothetical protein
MLTMPCDYGKHRKDYGDDDMMEASQAQVIEMHNFLCLSMQQEGSGEGGEMMMTLLLGVSSCV